MKATAIWPDLSTVVGQAWAGAERSNAVLAMLRTAPELWRFEMEKAELACAKANARLEATLALSALR